MYLRIADATGYVRQLVAHNANERNVQEYTECRSNAGNIFAVLIVAGRNEIPRPADLSDTRLAVHLFDRIDPSKQRADK